MWYTTKKAHSVHYKKVIGIKEYSVNGKWIKPKKSVGNTTNPITDEELNDFIQEFNPEEVNLIIIDNKGEMRFVDFDLGSLEQ